MKSDDESPPAAGQAASPPKRKKVLSMGFEANTNFFIVDDTAPVAPSTAEGVGPGAGSPAHHHPTARQRQPELMGPILRRKKVVSLPYGDERGNGFFYGADRRGAGPTIVRIDESDSVTATEDGSAIGGETNRPPAAHQRQRQQTAPASGGFFHSDDGVPVGGAKRTAAGRRNRRKKQHSFLEGMLTRRQVGLDLLPAEDAEFGFFRDDMEEEEEETKEEIKDESKEGEVTIKVREDTDAEGVQTIQEEEAQPELEEPKGPKLFKPLVFAPRRGVHGGGETHGGGHGGGGHQKPAPNEKTEVVAPPSEADVDEAVPLTASSKAEKDLETASDLQIIGTSNYEPVDDDDDYDDSHIIKAKRKDYIITGFLFLIMTALVGVVVGWTTHQDESDSIFGPVGLACITPCRGDQYDQDYFRGKNRFETGDVLLLRPHLDASRTSDSFLKLVIRGVETNRTKWESEEGMFGPANTEGERVTKEETVTVDWENPGEQHVIDVYSTTGSQTLPPPFRDEEVQVQVENSTTRGRRLEEGGGDHDAAPEDLPHHGELTYTLYATSLAPLAENSVLIAALIMVVVYFFILTEIIHRTLVAVFGSMVALFFFFLMHDGHTESIATLMLHMEWSTLGLLFGMMLIVGELSHTGVFEWCAVRLLVASKGSFNRLMVLLCSLVAVSSAFLDNVTTMLLIAPVTIDMCNILGVDPRPYLIGEVLLSNVGGTATLIGDPPNIIIGSSFEEIGFVDFIVNILPCIFFFCVPVTLFVVIKLYKYYLTSEKMVELNVTQLKRTYQVYDEPRLLIAGTTTFFVILMFFLHPVHHKDTAWIALIGAFITMAFTNPHDVQDALRNHIEWDTLLFFAGLFVLVEVCAAMGLLQAIGSVLASFIKSQDEDQQLTIAITLILWVSAITSAFLDNIPYTATMIPVVKILADELPDTLPIKTLAWALSLGACLGGNGTLLGASANIVTAGLSNSKGYGISFLNFFYPGMIVMVITVAIANVYMLVVYVWI